MLWNRDGLLPYSRIQCKFGSTHVERIVLCATCYNNHTAQRRAAHLMWGIFQWMTLSIFYCYLMFQQNGPSSTITSFSPRFSIYMYSAALFEVIIWPLQSLGDPFNRYPYTWHSEMSVFHPYIGTHEKQRFPVESWLSVKSNIPNLAKMLRRTSRLLCNNSQVGSTALVAASYEKIRRNVCCDRLSNPDSTK